MAELIVRTRGDAGGGFQFLAARSTKTVPAEALEAFSALEPLYPQLPFVESGPKPGLAVVTARFSPGIGRWVGVLQGSGGGYGAAGTVQFTTASVPMPLEQFLRHLLPAIDPPGYLEPGTIELARRRPLRTLSRSLQSPLAGLLRLDDARRVLVLDGDQAEGMTTLRELALFLPEGVARRYTWSSGLAVARVERSEYAITMAWSSEFRRRHAEQCLSAEAVALAPDAAADPQLPKGLRWALDQADRRRKYPLGTDSLAEWVAALEQARPYTTEEALALLARPLSTSQARRWERDQVSVALLRSDPRLLEPLLAHPSPEVSRGAVRHILGERALREQLVELERERAVSGGTPLVPVASLEPETRRDLARDVTADWSPAELVRARPWLLALGLRRETNPRFFPLDRGELARRLRTDASLADTALEFAARAEDPLPVLRALTSGSPRASGAVGAALVGSASQQRAAYLDSLAGSLRSRRGTIEVLKGADAYLSGLESPSTSLPIRATLASALAGTMAGEGPLPFRFPWAERNAAVLMLFLFGTGFRQSLTAHSRRLLMRWWLVTMGAVVAAVLVWMILSR